MSMQVASTPARGFVHPSRVATTRIGALVAASVFVIAGFALLGIGSALPLALAVVDQRGLEVDAGELALAQRLAPFWPALVGMGVVNFVAAFAILDRGALGKRIAMVVAGVTAALAVLAQVALVLSGADGAATGAATGVATAFVVTFVATTFVERRDD